jgi:hypothetical protein
MSASSVRTALLVGVGLDVIVIAQLIVARTPEPTFADFLAHVDRQARRGGAASCRGHVAEASCQACIALAVRSRSTETRSASASWRSSALRPRFWARVATTITLARTPGRAEALRRRRPDGRATPGDGPAPQQRRTRCRAGTLRASRPCRAGEPGGPAGVRSIGQHGSACPRMTEVSASLAEPVGT